MMRSLTNRTLLPLTFLLTMVNLSGAAPCARPKTLPSELPLLDCPKVTCLKGCDRRGSIVTELVYDDGSPKFADRWHEALDKAGWKVAITGDGKIHASKGHDHMKTVITKSGKQVTLTVTLDPG
jgi:hypothetical protein